MNKTIKITSGLLRGRGIISPGSSSIHPMGSREKLALFNMISEYLPGASVLDAFAGSGALGIEAISRGAKEVVFLEKSHQACEVIKKNLSTLGINGRVERGNVNGYRPEENFDVVIADPPYDAFDDSLIRQLGELVAKGGIMVLSHPSEPPELVGFSLLKTRQYARAHISVYARQS